MSSYVSSEPVPVPVADSEVGHRWFATRPSTLIVQPTTLCNLNCTYCYLPDRAKKRDMSVEVAGAIAANIPVSWSSSQPLEIVWHGGEPLTAGTRGLVSLMELFESLRTTARIRHAIQTNATLITDEWCDVFTNYDVAVGVSIDGPPDTPAGRVDWKGAPAHDRIIRGITTLQARGIPFTVIAVISNTHIRSAKRILDFLADLGCPYVGLNIEEQEGANTNGGTPTIDQARQFWRDTIEWSRENQTMGIREVDDLLDYLTLPAVARKVDSRHDLIPTITWGGDVVVLSPELAGTIAPEYDNFVAGNVLKDPLPSILERAHALSYVREFQTGIENCKATCEFFAFCQGSHACNRYFEHRSFTITETEHCKTSTQALVLALADLSETPLHNPQRSIRSTPADSSRQTLERE